MAESDTPEGAEKKKKGHWLDGIVVSAVFWWFGLIFLISPAYFSIVGIGATILIYIGILIMLFSLVMACNELGQIWQIEAAKDFTVAAFFFLLTASVYLLINLVSMRDLVVIIGKVFVLILLAITGLGFLYGVGHLFPNRVEERTGPVSKDKRKISEKLPLTSEAKISLAVAILSLITVIIQFIVQLE